MNKKNFVNKFIYENHRKMRKKIEKKYKIKWMMKLFMSN